MPQRRSDAIFRNKKTTIDINPGDSELAPVVSIFNNPLNQVGLLSGPSAKEYGPIKVTVSANDTQSVERIFEFDYQKQPAIK